MKKKNFKRLAPLALAGLLALGGAAAWLTASDTDTNTQSITAGTFLVEFDENNTSEFSLDAAYPMTAAVGESQTAGTFQIDNNGTIDTIIRLGVAAADVDDADADGGQLAENRVHVVIYDADNSDAKLFDGLLSNMHTAGGVSSFINIAASGSHNFKVRSYIDSAAANSDLYDNSGNAKGISFKLTAYYAQEDGGLFAAATPTAAEWLVVFPAN